MGISVLGPLTVDDSAARMGPRETLVLAALTISVGDVVSADQLADAVWGDQPPASWHKNLQTCIVRLRKALGADAIETVAHGYRLAVPADVVDARRFEALVARGRELARLGEPERAAYTLGQALALWRGRPLEELEDWEPGTLEAARLTDLRLDAQEWWLEGMVEAGRYGDVLAEARALVEAAPLRERRWELLALAQYRSGRQGEALQTIHEVRRRLADDLGLDPGSQLIALEDAILRQDPSLDLAPVTGPSSEVCPYLGLMPYDVGDEESFFGRDRDVAAALERLDAEGVLVVIGPSGSGKSSLVRAGVMAALARRGQLADVITPGVHPVGSLPPPRPGGAPRVLVVDQAEEVFSLCPDPDERDRFLAVLADRQAAGAPLVLALRADRMGDVSAHPSLARVVERGLYVLAAMSPVELRTAIEGPALQAGLLVEPGLADLLVREVEGEPGALPLLSHVLREAWLRREGRTLTVAGYRASGGIRGAVAQSAEKLYADLEPSQRPALHDLLLRLVHPGTEGEPVRARVSRRQVVTDPSQDRLVDLLVGSRLVTSDDGVVEIAHEALARAWPRLRGWLEDDVEGQRIMHHLTATADSWDALGRPSSELYRGVRLAQTVEWDERPHPELTASEREFLAASRELAEAEGRAAADTARQQARMIRRLRLVLGGAVVLLLVALAAGGAAVRQQGIARDNARDAVRAQTGSDARRAGARALSVGDIDTSLLLAVAGVRLDDSDATRKNLQDVLMKRLQLVRSTTREGAGVTGIELTSDGERLAVYDLEGRVDLFDTTDWRLLATSAPPESPPPRARIAPVAFAPDGSTLAVGMPWTVRDPVRLLDGHTLEPTGLSLPGLSADRARVQDRPIDLAWSADGNTLVAVVQRLYLKRMRDHSSYWRTDLDRLLVWRMEDEPRLVLHRTIPGRITERDGDRNQVALSADGTTAWTSRPLAAYDTTTGAEVLQTGRVGYALDLAPDEEMVAITGGESADNVVRLVDARTGRLEHTLRGHLNEVVALTFSPDGRHLVSTSGDGEGIVWDLRGGTIVERLALGDTAVQGLAFSPDGTLLLTAGSDEAIRSWDLDGSERFLARTREPGRFGYGNLFVSPGGSYTAHSTRDGLRFFDTATGEHTPWWTDEVCCYGGAFSPDGALFAGSQGHRLWIWEPRTGAVVRDNLDHRYPKQIVDLAWSASGGRIILTDEAGNIGMVDAGSLRPVGRSVHLGPSVFGTQRGPNEHTGFTLVSDLPPEVTSSFEYGGGVSEWALADLETGKVRRGRTGFKPFSLAASPDQQKLAIGGANGEVALVDVASGELVRSPVVAHDNVPLWFTTWSADGSRFATTGWDGSVVLWNGRTGLPIGSILVPEETIQNLAFEPDNETLLLAPYNDSVYLWDTRSGHAIESACRAAAGDFDEEEWAAWFGTRPYQVTCPDA